jgi:uroporphyrinogen decarboxylase
MARAILNESRPIVSSLAPTERLCIRPMSSTFLQACRGEPVDRTPIWVMRQAGRYLPEYQEVRSQTTFLGLCKTPDLAAEVTLQPLRRYGMDAGIIFSDILIPVEAMGMELHFDDGAGPRLADPLTSPGDIDRLRVPDPVETMGFVMDAVKQVCAAAPETPLIGFVGAPFTLAAYMVEGKGSRTFENAKRFMYEHPRAWRTLLQKITETIALHLRAQVEAGCRAVQIFDSWAGHLSPDDFRSFALPYIVEAVDRVKPTGVPVIVFAKGAHGCLEELAGSGADVLGLDWTISIEDARARVGNKVSLQGNLDPSVLLGPVERIERQAQRVLNEARGGRGHVFNLGHGILKSTPPEHLAALVEVVRREGVNRVPAELR